MPYQLILIILLTMLAIAAFLVWGMWRHYAEHRSHALRYENHSLTPPSSTVCPRCRRRSYSRRAVAERYCESCDLKY